MEATSQFTRPALVDRSNQSVLPLEPLSLDAVGQGAYDERWLQDLLYAHPALIPTEELEPVFAGAVSVCRELPTSVGPLDLVFINSQGLLTLVECKLWRNPEARRKVVGQILDYAQEISRWTYEQLEAAIARSESKNGVSLWEIARTSFDLTDEAAFIDRVSRHLRTGTFLLLVVGDGIRENTENIAAFLQKYAGLSFAFGLVEERLFRLPNSNQIIVQPRILAKTVELGRLIVRAEVGVITSEPTPEKQPDVQHGRTLTESMFVEEVAGTSSLAEDITRFFTRLKEADLILEPTSRAASLKVVPKGTKTNLLSMFRDGTVRNYRCGNTEWGKTYLEALQRLLPGAQIKDGGNDGWSSTVLKKDGSLFHIEDLIQNQAALVELFQKTGDQVRASNNG